MRQRRRESSVLCGFAAVTLAACDLGVFEFRLAHDDHDVHDVRDAAAAADASAVSTGARTQMVGVGQASGGVGGDYAGVDRFGAVGGGARAVAGNGGVSGSASTASGASAGDSDAGAVVTVDAGSVSPR